MVERLLFAAALVIVGAAVWIMINRLAVRRAAAQANTDPLLIGLKPNVPAIVYFTAPFCAPCRTQQKPALAALQAELGPSIQIIQVDATEQPDAADRWGVFSAPTTFVLDRQHRPRHVNRGVATTETLKRQLELAA